MANVIINLSDAEDDGVNFTLTIEDAPQGEASFATNAMLLGASLKAIFESDFMIHATALVISAMEKGEDINEALSKGIVKVEYS